MRESLAEPVHDMIGLLTETVHDDMIGSLTETVHDMIGSLT